MVSPTKHAQRERDQRPGRAGIEQHRAERDLQQVQEGEGIGGAAAEVELRGQRGHVDQQRDEQLAVGDRGAMRAAQTGSTTLSSDQRAEHRAASASSGRRNAEPEMHAADGHDLADHRDPAQLDQLQHVLAAGRVVGRAAPISSLRASACDCSVTAAAVCSVVRSIRRSFQHLIRPAGGGIRAAGRFVDEALAAEQPAAECDESCRPA